MRFEERKSPVRIKVTGEEVFGKNWTEAMLKGYSLLIEKYQEILLSKYVSIDIEPYTLEMLAEKQPKAFSSLMRLAEEGEIRLGVCPAFHPFLPHLTEETLEAVLSVTREIFSKIKSFDVLWLPECGYSRSSFLKVVKVLGRGFTFLLDEGQAKAPPGIYSVLGEKVAIRDRELSDLFSFSNPSPEELLSKISSGSILATDLETLSYSPEKIEVMSKFLEKCEKEGLKPSYEKSPAKEITPTEFSSWSDYSLFGEKRDSRWLGLRRKDMKAYHVEVDGKKVSQIWKYCFSSLISEAFHKLKLHFLKDYWRNFFPNISSFLKLSPYRGGFLARASFELLSCFRSCPTFWEFPDTRVTFQTVSVLSNAISDASRGGIYLKDIASLLQDFSKTYSRYRCHLFEGVEGWEASKKALLVSLNAFIPKAAGRFDIFRRASSFSFSLDPPEFELEVNPEASSPIASHIPSEAGFEWENKEFCEERRWFRCRSLEKTM